MNDNGKSADLSVVLPTGLSVDVRTLDREHQQLADRLNLLFSLMQQGVGAEACLAQFDTFVDEVRAHFAHEERVMSNIGLADFAEHKALHDQLLADIDAFRDKFRGKLVARDIVEAAQFLRGWFLRHVAAEDVKIRHHLEGTDEPVA